MICPNPTFAFFTSRALYEWSSARSLVSYSVFSAISFIEYSFLTRCTRRVYRP
jgi:hypothetical protein